MNTTTTLPQLAAAINTLTQERSQLVLTSDAILTARISALTTEAILDPQKKAELLDAVNSRLQVSRNRDRAAEIDRELRNLQNDRSNLEALDRKARADDADARMQAELDTYVTLATQLCRQYRRMLNMRHANASIPGARQFALPEFSLGHMHSYDPDARYKTSSAMREGLLRFEVVEQPGYEPLGVRVQP